MKQRVWLTATLVILGTLALTTALAHAQTISNGPYYATPSWDQKLQCDTSATVLGLSCCRTGTAKPSSTARPASCGRSRQQRPLLLAAGPTRGRTA